MRPAVLFAREDSIYKKLDCDVWDKKRNALNWPGGAPAVYHPPCRAWGGLRHMAKPRAGERGLALWSVCMVRIWGGVLEHPAASELWPLAKLPEPGETDVWGGWTYSAPQMWWGHRAEKPTRFYIVGITPASLPEIPFVIGDAPCIIGTPGRRRDGTRLAPGESGWRPEVSKAEREHTPAKLANWLLEIASKCSAPAGAVSPHSLSRSHNSAEKS